MPPAWRRVITMTQMTYIYYHSGLK